MPEDSRHILRKAFLSVFLTIAVISTALILYYIFDGVSSETWDYNIPRRVKVITTIALVSVAVGVSAVIFQTITANYILTPSIMGLDNLYLFLQTLVLYFLGSGQLAMMQDPMHFMLTVLLMVAISTGIFSFMFKGRGGSIYYVVLVGIVFGIAFQGLSSFMQVLIDPSEFSVLEGRMFASFNRINLQLLGIAGIVITGGVLWLVTDFRNLDVLTLGRSHAITLGVNYKRVVLKSLIIVAILTSASTVLVGPITFLGILIVSLARFLFPTYRHIILVPGTALVGLCILVFGMLITERVMNFIVPLSVIINFAGGLYFIYLLLKMKRL